MKIYRYFLIEQLAIWGGHSISALFFMAVRRFLSTFTNACKNVMDAYMVFEAMEID